MEHFLKAVIEREQNLDYAISLHKYFGLNFAKSKQNVMGMRLFHHTFVDDDDRKQVFQGSEEKCDGVIFIFKNEPEFLNGGPVIYTSLQRHLHEEDGATFRWIMYLDSDKSTTPKFLVARVKNSIELGSRHMYLAMHGNLPENPVFVSAGELKYDGPSKTFLWNHQSGTFIHARKQYYYYDDDAINELGLGDEEVQRLVQVFNSTIEDVVHVQTLLHRLNPGCKFAFHKDAFPLSQQPFKCLFQDLKPHERVYIIPDTSVFSNALEKIAYTGRYFKQNTREEARPFQYTVNARARYTDSSTQTAKTSASWKQMEEYEGVYDQNITEAMLMFSHVQVLPTREDLFNALRVLRLIGAKTFGAHSKPVHFDSFSLSENKNLDFFGINGKYIEIVPREKGHAGSFVVKVERVLGSSNVYVYLVTDVTSNKKLVLRCCPFSSTHGYRSSMILRDYQKFYGRENMCLQFILPKQMADCQLIPYFGVPVTKVSPFQRIADFEKFKRSYLQQFLYSAGPHSSASAYNDIKPENVCFDEETGKYTLIDVDAYSYTPQWYGNPGDRTWSNQLFGIVTLFYWFVSDHIPFVNIREGSIMDFAEKVRWSQEEIPEPYRKTFKDAFDVVLDEKLTYKERVDYLIQELTIDADLAKEDVSIFYNEDEYSLEEKKS